MKIAYITTYDASDLHNWSGPGYNIARAFTEENAEMEFIGNLDVRFNKFIRAKKLLYNKPLGQRYQYQRDPFVAKSYAIPIKARLNPSANCTFSRRSSPIARPRA